MRWNKSFEGTLHIYDADLQKMAKMLGDVNIKECPYFDLSDRYGNSARYYRENQWIPVSERLPNSNGIYNVTRKISDGFECRNIVDTCYFDGTNIWHDDTRINHGREYLTDIVAWMPLPEPYKENKL